MEEGRRPHTGIQARRGGRLAVDAGGCRVLDGGAPEAVVDTDEQHVVAVRQPVLHPPDLNATRGGESSGKSPTGDKHYTLNGCT